MKLDAFTSTKNLRPLNRAALTENGDQAAKWLHALQIALVICEVADAVVRGEASHITMGKTKSGDSLLLTLNYGKDQKMFAGGEDVIILFQAAAAQWEVDTTNTDEVPPF